MSFILSDTLNRSALKDKNLPSTPSPCMEDFSMSPTISEYYSGVFYIWILLASSGREMGGCHCAWLVAILPNDCEKQSSPPPDTGR